MLNFKQTINTKVYVHNRFGQSYAHVGDLNLDFRGNSFSLSS